MRVRSIAVLLVIIVLLLGWPPTRLRSVEGIGVRSNSHRWGQRLGRFDWGFFEHEWEHEHEWGWG
ncbi:hypothetical protein VN12_00690 [Pirellula sp. SH-Sr6A]|nr:hypothetical protein VN12_00690 [Pirellula sp. SH-Sr6A]